jgi:hypothetical protein
MKLVENMSRVYTEIRLYYILSYTNTYNVMNVFCGFKCGTRKPSLLNNVRRWREESFPVIYDFHTLYVSLDQDKNAIQDNWERWVEMHSLLPAGCSSEIE